MEPDATHTCPICDYPNLTEEPFYSYEICPGCGCEFGVDDGGLAKGKKLDDWHLVLRDRWKKTGRLWPEKPGGKK
jgi:hypothetical protein